MNKFASLLKKSPIGFITGMFRSDLCVGDIENIEKTYTGESNKRYSYTAINFVFEKNGDLLGTLRIPLTKASYDSGIIRSAENSPSLDNAEYGGLTLHTDSSGFPHAAFLPKCIIELSFDVSTDVGTFRAWTAEFSFEEKMDAAKERISKIKLEDLDLSVRAFNCLKAARINDMVELVQYTEEELGKFRNFGQKSIVEIGSALDGKGLHFGMTFNK